ncbi:MAG TPA: class I SAM-dependent methyltransferase [Patescibacteria group bacterium]|nr:class I SAM-dependent methyltransferase [Patescibacteria group bacterium]
MDEYKILADVYDILNPKEEIFAQKSFFEKLVGDYSVSRVLDCACGTGWHLSMFHDMGLTSFGSDISPEMLAMAKKNLEGKYIPLKVEDFRTLDHSWGDTFDMIGCLTTSLPHMKTDEDVVRALSSIYDRLSDNGILVITNGITDALLDSKPKFIPARTLENEGFYFVVEYPNEKEFTFHILYVKKTEDSMEHTFTSVTYNAMRKAVLERCFGQTLFRNVFYYGDYDFSPYSKQLSTKLIVVAQK